MEFLWFSNGFQSTNRGWGSLHFDRLRVATHVTIRGCFISFRWCQVGKNHVAWQRCKLANGVPEILLWLENPKLSWQDMEVFYNSGISLA